MNIASLVALALYLALSLALSIPHSFERSLSWNFVNVTHNIVTKDDHEEDHTENT